MKQRTSFALSEEAKRLLSEIASRNGISQAAVLELLIREKAKAEGIDSAALLQVSVVPNAASTKHA
jgi:hypothetical protein